MGFWGVNLLARTGADLAAVEEVESWGGEEDWRRDGRNGWRLVTIHGADAPETGQVLAAAREIGAPLLAAYVVDSDCAQVVCVTPEGSGFEFFVHPKMAATGYRLPVDLADQAAAPQRLVDWAGAGAGADLAALRTVLETDYVFAEDAMIALASALGAIPAAEATELMFGEGAKATGGPGGPGPATA